MKNNISSFELKHLVKELQIIKESRISNVFLGSDYSYIFELYSASLKKKYLHIKFPNIIFLTSQKYETIEANEFVKNLRQKVGSQIIKDIRQWGTDRVVEIDLVDKNIILEFYLRGNLILIEKGLIELVADKKKFENKTNEIGTEYKIEKPSIDYSRLNIEEINSLVKTDLTLNVGKFLAAKLGLGKDVSEYIISELKLNREQFANELQDSQKAKISKLLRDICQMPVNIDLVKNAIRILPGKVDSEKSFESISKGIEYYYQESKKKSLLKTSKYTSEINKNKKLIAKQEKLLENNEKTSDILDEKGNAIYANYEIINEVISLVQNKPELLDNKEFLEKAGIKKVNKKNKSILIKV